MRFDPKLIRAEDAPLDIEGEIDLPDDLGELASQLSADAAFLAQRYPAQSASKACMVTPVPVNELAARWSVSSRQGWLIVTASAALVLLVVTALSSPTADSPGTVRENAASSAPTVTTPSASSAISVPKLPTQDLPRLPVRTAPAAMFLNGVSGPELEGLLDLWQNDHETDTRISI